MQKMIRGVDSTFEELFAYACPKFVTASPPNLDNAGTNTNQVGGRKRCTISAICTVSLASY